MLICRKDTCLIDGQVSRMTGVPPPLPPVEAVVEVVPSRREEDYKNCPFCGEEVLWTAKKCKHCGETLDVAMRSAEDARRFAKESSRSGGNGLAVTGMVLGI